MEFFDAFSSCTAAGSGSQNWFETGDPKALCTGRVYYRLSRDVGKMALLFSNLIDSTFADGSHSHANFVPGDWVIHSLRAGVVDHCDLETCAEPRGFVEIRFDGKKSKRVMPGEIFASDDFDLSARKGEYICLETVFTGARVPCHTESLLPAFKLTDGKWQRSTELPFPSMLGAERGKEMRLSFLGDSITQGIGTAPNSYRHLAALLQDALGPGCAVWNLGLGFGRAHDAALDGGWLYKARQNDAVCVCYGVNDLFQTGDAEMLKRDLSALVNKLKQSGVKVLIQTVPPFDYAQGVREKWLDVNDFIRRKLQFKADAFFDTVPVLGKGPSEPHASRYGAHPNEEGNAAWAEGLLPVLKELLAKK
ncbi:MAG: SGNH/GDSL hydrolase family protein [Clostridia bacterium]|nr:SGNH/GDSL hydrolase family protein [Clostridia bacterium]